MEHTGTLQIPPHLCAPLRSESFPDPDRTLETPEQLKCSQLDPCPTGSYVIGLLWPVLDLKKKKISLGVFLGAVSVRHCWFVRIENDHPGCAL